MAAVSVDQTAIVRPSSVKPSSPPLGKNLHWSHLVEIETSLWNGACNIALKVQDYVLKYCEDNPQYQKLPVHQLAEKFRDEHPNIVAKCVADSTLNFDVISPTDIHKYRAYIDGDHIREWTIPYESIHSPSPDKPFIFVIKYNKEINELELYISGNERHNHASLLAGQPVEAAGEIYTDADGRITKITTQSGHYRPGIDQTFTLIDYMTQSGFRTSADFEFVVIEKNEFCKGYRTFTRLSVDEQAMKGSGLVVREGKIPKILQKELTFLSYYQNESQKIDGAEFKAFKEKFFLSTEWKNTRDKVTIDPNEYAKRRFILKGFARSRWAAKVKELKFSDITQQ
jgi:hypothetical protein